MQTDRGLKRKTRPWRQNDTRRAASYGSCERNERNSIVRSLLPIPNESGHTGQRGWASTEEDDEAITILTTVLDERERCRYRGGCCSCRSSQAAAAVADINRTTRGKGKEGRTDRGTKSERRKKYRHKIRSAPSVSPAVRHAPPHSELETHKWRCFRELCKGMWRPR